MIWLLSCQAIVWKRGEELPFKLTSGSYTFMLHEIDYPSSLEEKELFLIRMENSLKEVISKGNRVMLLLDENFMRDHLFIEREGILPEETFLKKPASLLTAEERALLGSDDKQELLNLQVKKILSILGRSAEFTERDYTELYKEELISKIFESRRRVIKIFKNNLIHLFIKIKNIFEEREISFEYKKYFYTKNLHLSKSSKINPRIKDYAKRATIILDSVSPEILDKILSYELRLNLKEYGVINESYSGYLSKREIVYLIGGAKQRQTNGNYNISVIIQKVDLEDLMKFNSTYVLKDLYKTKEEVDLEKRKLTKILEKIKSN